MANNYVQFSFDFFVPEGHRGWVREVEQLIEKHQGEEVDADNPLLVALPYWNEYQEAGFNIELDLEDGCCWIYAEENGNVDSVIYFLRALLKRVADESQAEFGFIKPDSMELKQVGFTYAETCSTMRVDNFGGGAVRVFLGDDLDEDDLINVSWVNSHEWLANIMD